MNAMHIDAIDLNLLRLFDAVYRARSVSRAAESLGLTQPAASHGLGRLRAAAAGRAVHARAGRRRAHAARRAAGRWRCSRRWARSRRRSTSPTASSPAHSRQTFRIHMSDIGEGRFLPALMARLRRAGAGRAAGDVAAAARRHRRGARQRPHRLRLRLPAQGARHPARRAAEGPLHRAAAQGPSLRAHAPQRAGAAGGPAQARIRRGAHARRDAAHPATAATWRTGCA